MRLDTFVESVSEIRTAIEAEVEPFVSGALVSVRQRSATQSTGVIVVVEFKRILEWTGHRLAHLCNEENKKT